MNRVDFSEFVKDDIDEIWSYIAIDDRENADRFIDTFAPIYKLLAGNRYMGRLRDELKPGMRSFPHGRYIIFYFPTDNGVMIYRVIHSARHLGKVFSEGSE